MFGLLYEKSSKYPMTPDNLEKLSSKKKTPPKQKNEFYERIIEKILQKDLESNTTNLDNIRSDIKQKVTHLTTFTNESSTYFFPFKLLQKISL